MSIPVHAIGDEQVSSQKKKVKSALHMLEAGNFSEAEQILMSMERDDEFLARHGLVPKEVKVKR